MVTNIDLDENLLSEAQELGGHRTKKAAVQAALEAYVKQRKALRILEMFGKVEFHAGYDHKSHRSR